MAEENLKFKRGQIKSRLTRLQNYLTTVDFENINDKLLSELNDRLHRFEPSWDDFNVVQSKIELVEPSLTDEAERCQFENSYFEITSTIKSICSKYDQCRSELGSHNSDAGNPGEFLESSRAFNHNLNMNVKLPIIHLPTFDGNAENWLDYKSTFNDLIDVNVSLPTMQKFYYLKTSLCQEALDIIKSLDQIPENYRVAWELLTENYENKALTIHNHIKQIFDLPKLKRESYIELKRSFIEVKKHLRALKSLGEKTENWDRLIIFLLSTKFDNLTNRDWENYKYSGELPTLEDMDSFLKHKCQVLQKLESNKDSLPEPSKFTFKSPRVNLQVKKTNTFINTKLQCIFCNKPHNIYSCEVFVNLTIPERISEIKKKKLCLNCLKGSHFSWQCKENKCKKCGKPHHFLLHLKTKGTSGNIAHSNIPHEMDPVLESTQFPADQQIVSIAKHSVENVTNSQILLSTAVVYIKNINNTYNKCRVLLDSASQSNFICQSLCNKLNLKVNKVNYAVRGVGQALENINKQVKVHIKSCHNQFSASLNCLVLPEITENLPLVSFNKEQLNIPENIQMADPSFNVSSPIQLLLGSSIFWTLLCDGQIKLGHNMPILKNSILGWLVAGDLIVNKYVQDSTVSCFSTHDNNQTAINEQIVNFWKIEEVNYPHSLLSRSEQFCESHFIKTTRRDSNGRFIVNIPFNNLINEIGNTSEMAKGRFFMLENKLNKNPSLKAEYANFMSEYINLGHMSEVDENKILNKPTFYLPHHAVVKDSSITTKLRVVFDASAKSSSGLSLNDAQFSGPIIQDDLFSIILRFRKYNFVITGDISKMYRQILVDANQRSLQRIYWRENSNDILKCYELNTVTYGTASAPFLAVRCLHELSNECLVEMPCISKIIKKDFYMDDLLTGSNSEKELMIIQKQITEILQGAGLELRKWLSNNSEILNNIQVNTNLDANILQLGENEQNKTLGIYWNSQQDLIVYSTKHFNIDNNKITKRAILSIISQIFDPLGLLGPLIVRGKLIIQEMWRTKTSWDAVPSRDICNNWHNFEGDLNWINNIKISRQAIFSTESQIEFHGFSDASERAYGACIYVRCIKSNGVILSNLLCAKSRVAPIKQISLPRLELCGALLLAQLMKKVLDALEIDVTNVYYWSDSTITLAWIQGEANRWKTFVGNRVGEIQSLTNINNWCYIKTQDNPADLLSRGGSAENIINSSLWWHGPTFLQNKGAHWNFLPNNKDIIDLPEQKTTVYASIPVEPWNLFNKFSSLKKLQRVTAYILRFISNIRQNKNNKLKTYLTPTELEVALNTLIKISQRTCFSNEYNILIKNKSLNNKSNILALNPFMAKDGLIRVGGRLKNSKINFDKKHPILLPKKHNITKLIFKHEHERLIHCGSQALLYAVRDRYWPISGRNIARSTIKRCLICFKTKPANTEYQMGNLPDVRINQFYPFFNVGVDYGGPFSIKDRQTRGAKIIKVYLCLFVCMSTKAVHLEAVTDLSTNSFLATLDRFISRRGKPNNIFSDNGSNFIGANNEIQKLYKFLHSESKGIKDHLANELINWHFIPARSPTFGGLWEAGIKSVKQYLKKVIGLNNFTFEQFSTILARVESILNSRPIAPLSSDPEDLNPLTPAHFLIGRPLIALPEPETLQINLNRLQGFKKIQAINQHFWNRWQKEYITELQRRVKWKTNYPELLKPGSLVLIRDENIPPMNWQLGRVLELYPGRDNVTRVVSLKVKNGTIRRGVNRVCILPIED